MSDMKYCFQQIICNLPAQALEAHLPAQTPGFLKAPIPCWPTTKCPATEGGLSSQLEPGFALCDLLGVALTCVGTPCSYKGHAQSGRDGKNPQRLRILRAFKNSLRSEPTGSSCHLIYPSLARSPTLGNVTK